MNQWQKDIIVNELEQFIDEPNTLATQENMASVLIPVIRKMMPVIISQDIIGVQSMGMTLPKPYEVLPDHFPPAPEGHLVIDANFKVSAWIQEQPIHMWKWHEDCKTPFGLHRFYISEKLYTLLVLKWS